MGYVTVREETEEKLHLGRDPAIKAWAILGGLIALGLGAAFYSSDYILWKIAYVSGAVFVGLNCMEDWEECIFDKKGNRVTVMRQSLIQRMFQTEEGAKIVSGTLGEIDSVTVEVEEVKYVGDGYVVVLHFEPGFSMGITEVATMGDKSEHEAVAAKIHKFLDLDSRVTSSSDAVITSQPKQQPHQGEEGGIPLVTSTGDTSSSDDDSFEQIDKADLMDMVDASVEEATAQDNAESADPDPEVADTSEPVTTQLNDLSGDPAATQLGETTGDPAIQADIKDSTVDTVQA